MVPHYRSTRVDHLRNGMRVLTRVLRHAPVASVMVWYGVGSRNEAPGQTGISHFLEHMMFKGTPRFPAGSVEEELKRRGAMWNAFTSRDYTAYMEVLPSRHLELGLLIEADRMMNMTFDPDLTVRERGTIVSEREGSENRPHFWLLDAIMHEAFREFPYRHTVLGYKDDIRATTAEALTAHYQRFYRPANATLVVTGDFEAERLLELAERHFGALEAGQPVEPLALAEPEQRELRRVEVRRPGPNPHFMATYRIPPAAHPDLDALTVAAAVLSGASPVGMGNSAAMGRSSRFYRKLVTSGLAASATGQPLALQHQGLLFCNATPASGVAPERLEAAILAEVDQLRHADVPEDELERARKQVRAQIIYSLESALNQGVYLGQSALTSSLDRFDRALERVAAVTAGDVRRVARAYLAPDQLTVGWFLPTPEPKAGGPAPVSAPGAPAAPVSRTPAYQQTGDHAVETPPAGPRREVFDPRRVSTGSLPGGAALLVYPVAAIPSVVVRVQMEAGAVHDPDGKAGTAQMTAFMLTRGSEAFSSEELALRTDSLGISLRMDCGRETAVATLKCLPEDLETGLGLLAEVLRHPTFPADELERVRDRLLVAVRESNGDTRTVAARRLTEGLYPEGHPYRMPVSGVEESLPHITAGDLADFHAARYGPRDAIVTAVGAVEPARLQAALAQHLAGWSGGGGRPAIPPVAGRSRERVHVAVSGKTQVDLAMGWPLVERRHPDYLALEVLAVLFGGNGTAARNRLFRDVREKYGLSYYQSATYAAGSGPTSWTVHLGISPARLDFAIDIVLKELDRLAVEPVPAAELGALQDFLEDYPALQFEAAERIAGRLAEAERFGLGPEYLVRYPSLVRALTPEQLRDVAARYLVPEKLTIITAGPELPTA